MNSVNGPLPNKLKCILFDLGSTLIYFDSDWSQVLDQAMQALLDALASTGISFSRSSLGDAFRARIMEYQISRDIDLKETPTLTILLSLLDELGMKSIDESFARNALNAFYRTTQLHWIPEEDAYPTLEKLYQRGYRLGIISNAGDDNDVQVLVDKINVRPFLDIVLSSAACGIRKPDPEIFHIALNEINCTPDESIMIGDNLEADIQGAHRAGMLGIWINRRVSDAENLVESIGIKPDATIDNLSVLPEWIASSG